MKLPVAGFRFYFDGSLTVVGSYGFYWSGSVGGKNARVLYFYSGDAGMGSNNRTQGFSVRCRKD